MKTQTKNPTDLLPTKELLKRNSIKAILLLLFFFTLSSCRKDDPAPTPVVYPEENPLDAYLNGSGFKEATTNFINSGNYEFGYKFIPKVNGNINAVTFKIPDNATNTRVTIWDNTTKTVLKTITIASSTANVEFRQNIDPFPVVANKEYLLTYNGNDWYKRNKTSNAAATYPISAGNINISGYQWLSGSSQIYPTNVDNTYYAGDLSLVFQQMP